MKVLSLLLPFLFAYNCSNHQNLALHDAAHSKLKPNCCHLFSAGITEDEREDATTIQMGLVILLMLPNIIEVGSYSTIAVDMFAQHKSMLGMLTKAAVQQRYRGSAINLSGQLVAFVVEILTNAGFVLMVRFASSRWLGPAGIPLLLCVQSAILSVINLLASPELRRHLME